jgi:hypothetical protein
MIDDFFDNKRRKPGLQKMAQRIPDKRIFFNEK